MKPVELAEGVYWVGAVDWAVRDFHGYETSYGTTYNNYLILDDEPTLVDTVKFDFAEVCIRHIRNIIDPAKIRHIVINHIENDHATGIDKVMALCPGATIYITDKGLKGLSRFFDLSAWKVRVVKSGDTLNIGRRTLRFVETPMLHWPDSMMTWVENDRILFSQDAFGQHIASSARFDDEIVTCASMAMLDDAVTDYYANILMPFGNIIKSKIAEIAALGIDPAIIAPDHGIIWRSHPGRVIQSYLDMANGRTDLRVAIIYDTMWHSTEEMARFIAQGIKDEGVDAAVIKLRATPMSAAIKEFWKSRGCLIGSPTLNNIMFPTVAEFMTHVRGLRPKNRLVGAFGSYGWGGGAVKDAYEEFKRMRLEMHEPGLQILYKPSAEDEAVCYEYGKAFAARVKAYHAQFP